MLEKGHREKALKIVFLEEKEEMNKKYYDQVYDIVCTHNTGFDSLDQTIKLMKKKSMIQRKVKSIFNLI